MSTKDRTGQAVFPQEHPLGTRFTYQREFGDHAFISVNSKILTKSDLDELEKEWKCISVSVVRNPDMSLSLLLFCRKANAPMTDEAKEMAERNARSNDDSIRFVGSTTAGTDRHIADSFTIDMDIIGHSRVGGELLAIRAMDGERTPFAIEITTIDK